MHSAQGFCYHGDCCCYGKERPQACPWVGGAPGDCEPQTKALDWEVSLSCVLAAIPKGSLRSVWTPDFQGEESSWQVAFCSYHLFVHQNSRLGSVLGPVSQAGFRDSRSSERGQPGQGSYSKWGDPGNHESQTRMQKSSEEVLSSRDQKAQS